MRCGECGCKTLEKKNIKGRKFLHLDYIDLELKFDLFVLSCLECPNIILSSKDIRKLSRLLDSSII